MAARGPSSKVDSQLSGAVSGSIRCSVSSGKGMSTKVSGDSIDARVSDTGGVVGRPNLVTWHNSASR
jgi:hypothetical protein